MPLNSAKLRSKLREFSVFTQGCLVPIFTTIGVVTPPENNLIMSGTLIRSFKHLEHQNPSIISWDIGRARRVQQFLNGGNKWNGTERRNGMEYSVTNFLISSSLKKCYKKCYVFFGIFCRHIFYYSNKLK